MRVRHFDGRQGAGAGGSTINGLLPTGNQTPGIPLESDNFDISVSITSPTGLRVVGAFQKNVENFR